jgi:hypothetical protein
MTHQLHPNAIHRAVQALAEYGFDGMAQAMESLFNECMKMERRAALGVGRYERSESRRGQANGFKPKTSIRCGFALSWRFLKLGPPRSCLATLPLAAARGG